MLESSQIARKSVGYSGAALALLCSDAAFRSVLRSKQLVDPREEVPPRLLESLSVSQLDFHVSLDIPLSGSHVRILEAAMADRYSKLHRPFVFGARDPFRPTAPPTAPT